MIESHLRYCILAWGSDPNRIAKLQKKAIRTISNAKYNAHNEPLLKKLGILSVTDIFHISCLTFYYKFKKGELPINLQTFRFPTRADIHDHNTRLNNTMFIAPLRTVLAKNCVRNQMSYIINSTPNHILNKIDTHSRAGFVSCIKSHFIANYSGNCNIHNCYVCGN